MEPVCWIGTESVGNVSSISSSWGRSLLQSYSLFSQGTVNLRVGLGTPNRRFSAPATIIWGEPLTKQKKMVYDVGVCYLFITGITNFGDKRKCNSTGFVAH